MKKKSSPGTAQLDKDIDALSDDTPLEAALDPETGDELEAPLTATDLETLPAGEGSADDLTADTLIGDPRDEKPLAADEDPPTIPRRQSHTSEPRDRKNP